MTRSDRTRTHPTWSVVLVVPVMPAVPIILLSGLSIPIPIPLTPETTVPTAVATGVAAVTIAAALDWLVREPPAGLHPVVWFGRVVALLDRNWSRPVLIGLLGAVLLPASAAMLAGSFVSGAMAISPVVGTVFAGIVLFTVISLRLLLAEAAGVIAASETDVAAARERLPALVGRDPDALTPAQVRSAAVESAAENLADGLVGPLSAFALCAPLSVPLATAAAVWIKAVNTMDSMLGYPDRPVGTASARLDDAAMWLPARMSAGLIALSTASATPALRARRSARVTASPNAGWPMGALADAMRIRLVKPGVYELNPDAELPDSEQAERAVATVGRAGMLAFVLAVSWIVLWGVAA